MRLNGTQPGDLVEADVRGQSFFARVVGIDKDRERPVEVESLNGKALGYQFLKPRDIAGSYSKRAGSR